MRNAYIVSKPLQYFNSKNINDNQPVTKDCFIVNNFIDAPKFAERVKQVTDWNLIKLFSSDFTAILYLIFHSKKYDNLYIYADISTILSLFLRLIGKVNIHTYEEGFGSYRYLEYRSNNLISRYLRRVLGVTNWMGGNKITSSISVYHPNVLRKLIPESKEKNIRYLSKSFYDTVIESEECDYFFNDVDLKIIENKKVFLVLGSWEINEKYIDILKDYPDYMTILKPHPHFRKSLDNYSFDLIIRTMPAEILISKLINICIDLIVIHEDSTTMIYLPLHLQKRITEINISEDKQFRDIYDNIRRAIQADTMFNK